MSSAAQTAPYLRVVVSDPGIATSAETVADVAGCYGRMVADLAVMIDVEAERSAQASACLLTSLRELREALEALARGDVPL